ncbi:accessory gene regulator ArgB-like protein [Petrocella sp. FN5]|uniref:accessory gene regulator ArgB-like protein n=1 Tax=Petrocella sp. FN5 TaxID=3032002 RepID=UPI0023DCA201|nr:accessory gene regulator B family protein [Petrocella sp. FN5]MDF1618200.1 accessory gene regulator B family protein [Petrocella sp. FN5]
MNQIVGGGGLIKQFAKTLTSFFMHEMIIESEDYEVYLYGTEQLLINLSILLVVITTSAITGWWKETFFFFFGIIPIRVVAGGYHASTPFRCNILTIVVYIVNLLLINALVSRMTVLVLIMMFGFIVLSVFRIGPVDNKNREIKNREYESVWKRSKKVCIFIVMICVVQLLLLGPQSSILMSTLMGAVVATISLIIGSIVRGGERNEENRFCT